MRINIDIPNNCIKDNFIYHYSNELYKELKPLALQNNINESKYMEYMTKERYSAYSYDINGFFEPLSLSMLNDLIKHGFKNWVSDELFEYKINLNEFTSNKFDIHSSIEERKFMDKHYNDFINKYSNRDEAIKKYNEFKYSELNVYGLTLEQVCEYKNSHNFDMADFVKYNIKHGYKYQYATYIPHISVSVKEPIKWVSVKRVK